MNRGSANEFRAAIAEPRVFPLIGVYDVFSATIAAQHYDGIFISGFGFAASYYGFPAIGFNAWSDIVAFVQRVRMVLPRHYITLAWPAPRYGTATRSWCPISVGETGCGNRIRA